MIVRAWPRALSKPPREHPHFNQWALAQLCLYKPHRSIHELCIPSVTSVFDAHVTDNGFPNINSLVPSTVADNDSVENELPHEIDLLKPGPLETNLQQNDYHELMNISRVNYNFSALLGACELDLIHIWPSSWHGIPFDALVAWIVDAQKDYIHPPIVVEPLHTDSFSPMQHLVFDIVNKHCFSPSQHEQLLMIVIGTAGTGKLFLINSFRSLFAERGCTNQVKITAPTGIAATNISSSMVHSLLSLLSTTLSSQRLVTLQTLMRDVRLLIIDEFSFLGAAIFDTLDRHLRLIYPLSTCPFGGLNILLCSHPAQLPPVCAQPMNAHCGPTAHLAAWFHLFDTVVELDQPFRQIGNDSTQSHFRSLLQHVANCEATEDDWNWLQSCQSCCLSADNNVLFDDGMYIVGTNTIREKINYEKLAAFAPIMKIEHCDDSVHFNDQILDGEHVPDKELKLFAIGARVILTTNLWTETGLVNGAYGVVESILKPVTNSNTRVLMVNLLNYHGLTLFPSTPTVVPITQIRSKHFSGLPLSLSWAIMIHKSQGVSMDCVTIDLGQSEFAAGITFVALSQVRQFDGLCIITFDFDRYRRIKTGVNVLARHEEFRCLCMLAAATISCVTVRQLAIIFL